MTPEMAVRRLIALAAVPAHDVGASTAREALLAGAFALPFALVELILGPVGLISRRLPNGPWDGWVRAGWYFGAAKCACSVQGGNYWTLVTRKSGKTCALSMSARPAPSRKPTARFRNLAGSPSTRPGKRRSSTYQMRNSRDRTWVVSY